MNKVEKIKAEIERLKKSLPWGSCASQLSMECNCKNEAYNEVLSHIDSLSDTEKDFGIKNTVWHDANNVPTKKELCLIMLDSNNGLTLNNVEVVIANPLARRFVTCSYPHKTGKQYIVQGETPIQVDVYHSCRDYIPFSDVDKWAYISDIFNLNNSQEEPVSKDLDSFAKEYSFNIPSDIYNLLPKEKQASWIIEIENAVKACAQWQKEQIIDKACGWLNNYFKGVAGGSVYIDDFKKAMEE